MARVFSQTLIRSPLSPPPSRFVNFRWRSGRPEELVQIFETEIEPAADGPTSSSDAAARGEAAARRLESVIHGVIVRHAAPVWLPFIPGSSYWVPPPRRSEGLAELLGRTSSPMSDGEAMSLTSMRGWPCAEQLLGDISPEPVDASTKEALDDEDV